MRIASLLPSATEIVYALGAADDLVAVTMECDEPADARRDHRVVVSGGTDTSSMTPSQIDAHVRATVAAGGDLYRLDAGALDELAPDVILAQDLCRVCAVPSGQVDRALQHLGVDATVITLDPSSLHDVLGTILDVGRGTGLLDRAEELVAQLHRRLRVVEEHVAGLPRPGVLVLEWTDPPFSAGHWVPDLVIAAGGRPVGLSPGPRSEPIDWDGVRAAEPDAIVVAPCGFHLADAVRQAEQVLERLPDVPVWAMDADGLVVRPGPRLVTGVEALSHALHPDAWDDAADPAAIRRVR